MLRSMTGFGRFVQDCSDWAQVWEIRSVNNRYLDIKWRLPGFLRAFESRFEKVVRRFGQRGRLDISLNLELRRAGLDKVSFNARHAGAMLDELQAFAQTRGESFAPDYNRMMGYSFLWEDDATELDETLAKSLEEGLAAALADWNIARAKEADALRDDMLVRVDSLETWAGIIAQNAPQIKEAKFAALRERISEVLSRNELALDEGRFLQEITVASDKLDISEEITRMNAHLVRMRELLAEGKDAGKRLDFTLQECFREINTCGNKVQDPAVSRIVVDFKNELEKCREQVQNLE